MLIKINPDHLLPVKCEVSSALLPWITYEDSLTERLQEKAGYARLQVIGQRWDKPNWWDQQVLHIRNGVVFHREIVMWAGQDACWYARTIIPEATYKADFALFDRLQKESLRELIFNEPRVTRAYMMHYPICKQSIEYTWLSQLMHSNATVLWVRASAFIIQDKFPFYLLETLLPALERYSR